MNNKFSIENFNINNCLKQSALSKAKKINHLVKNVTIGPNSNLLTTNNYINNENPRKIDQTDSYLRNNKSVISPLKLYRESELERSHVVEKLINDRYKKFIEEEKKLQQEKNLKEQILKDSLANQLRQKTYILETKIKLEEQKIHESRQNKLKALADEEQKLKTLELETEKVQKKLLQKNLYSKIQNSLSNFSEEFGKFIEYFKQYENISKNINRIHEFQLKLNNLQGKYDFFNNITEENVESRFYDEAFDLNKTIHVLNKLILNEIELEQSAQQKSEVETKEVTQQPIQIKEIKKHFKEQFLEFVSDNSLAKYNQSKLILKTYRDNYQNLFNDQKLKKLRSDLQKAINIPANAISAIDRNHLLDKYNRLFSLLNGDNVEIGNARVSINQHPEAFAFCLTQLAQKLVRQGETTVSSNPDSAYAFAAIIVALWNKFPDFGQLVLAHFYEICIYLVPMYPAQSENQSLEDYYKVLGYKYNDGEVEKQDKYLKRMGGLVRLYSAILITNQRIADRNLPHPYNLSNGWRFLAAILNLEPRTDITATVLLEFLEVTGHQMYNVYNKQFAKILMYIYKKFFPYLKKIDSGGPVTRLELWLENILKVGIIPPAKGCLSVNFW